jgi:solute carrier family 50 protein (sugar transporter)
MNCAVTIVPMKDAPILARIVVFAVLVVLAGGEVDGLLRSVSTNSQITTLPHDHNRRLEEIQGDSVIIRILELAGPTLFIGLQCSSLNTAVSILRDKSIGKLSAVPFGSLFVNCLLWTLYGSIKNNGSVFYPNLLGFFVATFCMSMYHEFALKKPWDVYLLVSLISLLCLGLAQCNQVHLIGLIGCILSIILSGSPLAVVRTVIQDRSTAALPFATSFVTWLNNLSWVLFGYFVAHDPLIYLPNILGFTLSSIQLLLFAVYGFPLSIRNKKPTTTQEVEV